MSSYLTYKQWSDNNPNFWDTTLTESYPVAVQSMIYEWFYYRYICSDNPDKFTRMFNRKLNLLANQFSRYYHTQMELEFDPLTLEKIDRTVNTISKEDVNEIIDRIFDGLVKNTGTESTNGTSDITTNNTRTLDTISTSKHTGDDKTNNTVSSTTTNDTDNTDTGTVGTVVNGNDSRSEDTDSKYSDYPQSTPGNFENYISNETITNGTSSGTTHNDTTETRDLKSTSDTTSTTNTTTDNTVTYNSTDTATNTGTITDAGTNNNTTNSTLTMDTSNKTDNNDKSTRTNAVDTNTNSVESIIRTGNATELVMKYITLVRGLNAVQWLLDELDVVFIQVFDDDDMVGNPSEIEDIMDKIKELESEIAVIDKRSKDNENNIQMIDSDIVEIEERLSQAENNQAIFNYRQNQILSGEISKMTTVNFVTDYGTYDSVNNRFHSRSEEYRYTDAVILRDRNFDSDSGYKMYLSVSLIGMGDYIWIGDNLYDVEKYNKRNALAFDVNLENSSAVDGLGTLFGQNAMKGFGDYIDGQVYRIGEYEMRIDYNASPSISRAAGPEVKLPAIIKGLTLNRKRISDKHYIYYITADSIEKDEKVISGVRDIYQIPIGMARGGTI